MKVKFFLIVLLFSGISLAACSAVNTPTDEPQVEEIPIAIAETKVVADGMLVPKETVDLAFAAGGEVAEVLVEEGNVLSIGDVIARLSGRERLESAVAAAELEVQAAQNDLLAAEVARTTLDDDLSVALTQTLDQITQSKEAVRTFERRVRNLSSTADQADIDEAKASVILAEDALEKAQDAYEPYADKAETNLIRANLLGRLAVAQRNYDDAVRRLNNLQGITGDEFDLEQAKAELQIAQSRLDQSEEDYQMYQAGPHPDAVKLADSRITTAEVRLSAAESALVAAESALSDLDLIATIDGTVVDLNLTPGEQVTPGKPIVTLADFSQWYVETDNLTEIDVVDISPDQKVRIVPDALPELSLAGIVETISDKFEEKRGDITYTTRILIEEIDPRLRWGMTVVITFEE
ncbi:MAG: efflux RND transporter periplasmic adaptor subunit [Chloroflexota bacterium]|nr:MAG: efflux RND transporter periplasmic adaptor subunit [Chloroflexota bacterium]